MPSIQRFLFLVFLLLAAPCFAQGPDASKPFDDARQQLADIRKQLKASTEDPSELDDAQLGKLRDAAGALLDQANALAADRVPKLAALEARGNALGPAPEKGVAETPEIAAQRADIEKQRAAIDGEVKQANLIAEESQQLVGDIAEARRAGFRARFGQRTDSPLSPTFWSGIADSFPRDATRVGTLRTGLVTALRDSFAPDNRWFALGGLAVGLLLIVFGRWRAERWLMQLTADRVPHGRLRRSALAFAVVAITTLFTGFGAQAIASGLDWHGALTDAERALMRSLVNAVFVGSFVAGLGRALLSAARPSWRLPPIGDALAQRLRRFPLAFGAVAVLAIVLGRLNRLANVSLSATICASLVIALLDAGLIAWALLRAGRTPEAEDPEPAPRPAWAGFTIGALWIGVAVTVIAALLGYVSLANLVATQMVWFGIVAGTFYLLVHLIEDICASALSSRANWAQKTLGLEPRLLDQAGVLFSGAFRVVAFLFAIAVAVARFGSEPAELIARGTQAGSGLKIGQILITPGAVLGAVLVFLFGLIAIRMLQRWLLEKYLPTTRIDPGMRSSVTTLLGYAGGVVVFAFALSAMGLSVERIAWVASALSVGIGFGLQAIVQNFVSGLILLVERPVKVGDWVVLGDTEGDIRRINVRATEIQMGDRSTVIVPNSELITKSVRNVTLANAEGRVLIRLPLPIDTDADRVRELLLASIREHPGVLDKPAPSVLLDGIQGGSILFVATAYIASPRQAGSVRSDLLFDLLARLRSAGIALSTPYDVKLRSVPEPVPPEA
jgi:small-conductance mechanosensitive channel